jgi:hypothetical protein
VILQHTPLNMFGLRYKQKNLQNHKGFAGILNWVRECF